jgi:hypothetical protein
MIYLLFHNNEFYFNPSTTPPRRTVEGPITTASEHTERLASRINKWLLLQDTGKVQNPHDIARLFTDKDHPVDGDVIELEGYQYSRSYGSVCQLYNKCLEAKPDGSDNCDQVNQRRCKREVPKYTVYHDHTVKMDEQEKMWEEVNERHIRNSEEHAEVIVDGAMADFILIRKPKGRVVR